MMLLQLDLSAPPCVNSDQLCTYGNWQRRSVSPPTVTTLNFREHRVLGSLYLRWMAGLGEFRSARKLLHEERINVMAVETDKHRQKKSMLGGLAINQPETEQKSASRDLADKWLKVCAFPNLKEKGRLSDALDRLDRWGTDTTIDNYASLLRQCAHEKALTEGKRLHAHIMRRGYGDDRFLGNNLVSMYGKCGRPDDARSVFDLMPRRDVVSWNAMIAAYTQNGNGKEALELYRCMDVEGVKPNKITFICVLDACANLAALAQGKGIHASVVDKGFSTNVVVGTALLNMYGKCGSPENAKSVFDMMTRRDVVCWNAMIAAYAQNGHGKLALELYRRMGVEGVKPDKITFICVLDACASMATLVHGQEIHVSIVESGFQTDLAVGNALVNMYGKCGSPTQARNVFDMMPRRDVISWTAMIAAYAHNGCGKDALKVYRCMGLEGVKPNKITFISALEACASLADLTQAQGIHASIVDCGFDTDMIVRTALVSMYGKCGSLDKARSIFDKMLRPDVVSWNAMIAAYVQNERDKEALELFQRLNSEGVKPNKITFISGLDACASLAALVQGQGIHASIMDSGFETDVVVGTALVNMYGKCGSPDDARGVFDMMPQQDVVSWSAMIASYAQNGCGKEALELFQRMGMEGMKSDSITFISILSACSHTGMLDDGWWYLVSMTRDHGIRPLAEHYVCMIDLIGRAGHLDEAEDLINSMPFEPNAVAWKTFLGACRIYGEVERAACAAKCTVKLDQKNAAPYILLSNIYAAAGRHDDVAKVRQAMEDRHVKKHPGISCIEVKERVYQFFVGDTSHPQTEEIYAELQRLNSQMKEAGYMPDTKAVLHDVEDEEKEHLLCHHSEKLAIAFGVISTHAGAPLRIIKNLRVCSDCHVATKFISRIVGRKIILRDANRFHHFEHGVCSCGDYW